jgi:hypothetical protein
MQNNTCITKMPAVFMKTLNRRSVNCTWLNCLLASACLLLAGHSAWAQSGLVLQYTFDDYTNTTFAFDSSANPTNGFFAGTATRTSYGQTPTGTGFALDLAGSNSGVNNWLTVSNAAKLNNLTNFTLCAWVNLPGTNQPAANDRIFGKEATGSGLGLQFVPNTGNVTLSNSSFRVALNVNGTSSGIYDAANLNASNQWLFVAVTYNGTIPNGLAVSNAVQFYSGSVNAAVAPMGVSGGAALTTGYVTNNSNQLRIGGTQASGSDRTPPALVDDVRIYNTVLTSSDLEAIRQSNIPASVIVSVSPNQTTVLQGTNVTFTSTAIGLGAQTPTYQWLFASTNIPGATSSIYNLNNVQAGNSGLYGVIVSNNVAVITNNSISLTVVPLYNTAALTNKWNLLPPQTTNGYTWLAAGVQERSMAFNPVATNLIVVHRSGTVVAPYVVVLDALTGNFIGSLDTTGLIDGGYSGVFPLNVIAVADDGVIYSGSMTLTADSDNYVLYSWQNEGAAQSVAYHGDPGAPNYPGQRWGDAMAVRGSGTNTQILLSSATTNVVAVLTTADGINYTSTAILVTNAPATFATVGLAWGTGTNTLYAKAPFGTAPFTNQLYFVQFDLNSGFGFVQYAATTNGVPGNVGPLGLNVSSNLLAALEVHNPGYDLVNIYSIANKTNDPVLLGQQVVTYNTLNGPFGGSGSVDFAKIGGTNYLFVLDTGNGITAYQIGSLATALTSFNITGVNILPGNQVVLTWHSVAGHNYQVQSKNALTDSSWSSVGGSVSATASSTTTTNTVSGVTKFFRISGQ